MYLVNESSKREPVNRVYKLREKSQSLLDHPRKGCLYGLVTSQRPSFVIFMILIHVYIYSCTRCLLCIVFKFNVCKHLHKLFVAFTYELPHGKTNNLHSRKQRRRSASR